MSMSDYTQPPEGSGQDLRPSRLPLPTGATEQADASVLAWESAYRSYGEVSHTTAPTGGDPAAVWQMAATSMAVALAWRQIARSRPLPWWTLAALESAAQAFESQGREWEARTRRGGAVETTPVARPPTRFAETVQAGMPDLQAARDGSRCDDQS
jgi:hypothetical protein